MTDGDGSTIVPSATSRHLAVSFCETWCSAQAPYVRGLVLSHIATEAGRIAVDALKAGIEQQLLGAHPVADLDEQVGVSVEATVCDVVQEGFEARPLQQDRGHAVGLELSRHCRGDLIDVAAPGLLRELGGRSHR